MALRLEVAGTIVDDLRGVIVAGLESYVADLEEQRDNAIQRAEQDDARVAKFERRVAELEKALKQALPLVEAHCAEYGDDGPLGKLRAVLRKAKEK